MPQEILDRIISWLCWDKEALQACALTHRAWTRASQEYLHDSQTFNWQDGDVPVPEQYSNPEIASMVRSIYLAEPPSPTCDPEAWALLTRFPRVTELSISCADWYSTAEDRDKVHAAFGQVTKLSLGGCTWQHGHDLVYFLSAFPNVTDLEVKDPSIPSARCMDLASYPRQKIDLVPGSSLRTLKISWDDPSADFDEVDMNELVGPWLSHFPSVVPEGLHFKWSSSHRWSAFPACIRAVGPVLDRLDVSFLDNDPAPGTSFATLKRVYPSHNVIQPISGLTNARGCAPSQSDAFAGSPPSTGPSAPSRTTPGSRACSPRSALRKSTPSTSASA